MNSYLRKIAVIMFSVLLSIIFLTSILHIPFLQKKIFSYVVKMVNTPERIIAYDDLKMTFPFTIKGDNFSYQQGNDYKIFIDDFSIQLGLFSFSPSIKNFYIKNMNVDICSTQKNEDKNNLLSLNPYDVIGLTVGVLEQQYIDRLYIEGIHINESNPLNVLYEPFDKGHKLDIFYAKEKILNIVLSPKEDAMLVNLAYKHQHDHTFLKNIFSFLETENNSLREIETCVAVNLKKTKEKFSLTSSMMMEKGNIQLKGELKGIEEIIFELINETNFSLPFFGKINKASLTLGIQEKNICLSQFGIQGEENSVDLEGVFQNENKIDVGDSLTGKGEFQLLLTGKYFTENFIHNCLEGKLVVDLSQQSQKYALNFDLDNLDSEFYKALLNKKIECDLEISNENIICVLNGLKGNSIEIRTDAQFNQVRLKADKKVDLAFLDDMNIEMKKNDNGYHVKGYINPIGDNMLKMDFAVDSNKKTLESGFLDLDFKDFAPLLVPFNISTVASLNGKISFEQFDFNAFNGRMSIDVNIPFIHSTFLKTKNIVMKGHVTEKRPVLDIEINDCSIGETLLIEKTKATSFMKEGKNYFHIQSHSDEVGYVKSNFDFSIEGFFDDNQKTLIFTQLYIQYLNKKLELAKQLEIQLAPYGIKKGELYFDKGVLSFENISCSNQWDGRVKIEQISLSILNWFFPKTIASGVLNGYITLEGKNDYPDFIFDLKGEKLHWHQSHTTSKTKSAYLDVDVQGRLLEEVLSLSIKLGGEKYADCFFNGTIPFGKNTLQELKGQFRGFIELTLLSAIIATGDRLSGKINFDLNLAGNFNHPIWKGSISTQNAYVELAKFGTIINNITGRIVGDDKHWKVENITATDKPLKAKGKRKKEGSLLLKGTFDFQNITEPEVDLSLLIKDYLVVNTDEMSGVTDALLKVKGKGIYSTISGDVDIQKFSIDLDRLQTEDSIPTIHLKDPHKNHYARDYQKEHFNKAEQEILPLDLKLKTNNNFSLAGLIIRESTWGGDILVKGPISDPYLVGSVSILNGAIVFFEKVMKIETGKVIFSEHDPNEPWFTLRASRKIFDTKVGIMIDNKQDPVISFYSSPSMPQSDILSWILFGKGVSTISPAESITLATALTQSKTSKGLNPVEGIRKIFGLDSLELREQVDQKSSNLDQESQRVIYFGKKVTDSIELSFEQGAGQNTSSLGLEMELGNNFVLNADVAKNSGDNSNVGRTTGLGLNWNKRY